MIDDKIVAIKALKEGFAHLYFDNSSQFINGELTVGIYYGDNKPDVFIEWVQAISLLLESDLSRDQIIDALWVLQFDDTYDIGVVLKIYDERQKLEALINVESSTHEFNF